MFKKFFKYILFLVFLLTLPSSIFASDLEINCFSHKPPEIVKNTEPLFQISEFMPGDFASRTIFFENTDSENDCRIFFDVSGNKNILSDKLRVNIPDLFDGTLSEYMDSERMLMANLQPNQGVTKTITMSLPSDAGNVYASTQTSFDILIQSEWGFNQIAEGRGAVAGIADHRDVLGVSTLASVLPQTGQGILFVVIFSAVIFFSFLIYKFLFKKANSL